MAWRTMAYHTKVTVIILSDGFDSRLEPIALRIQPVELLIRIRREQA